MNLCAHENIGRIIFFIKIKFIIGLVIWLCIHAGQFIFVMSVFEPKIKNDLKMILENYFGRKKRRKEKTPRPSSLARPEAQPAGALLPFRSSLADEPAPQRSASLFFFT